MQLRPLGTQGLTGSPLGLGCMGMSDFYGAKRRSTLDENLDALSIELTAHDLTRLDAVLPKGAAATARWAKVS